MLCGGEGAALSGDAVVRLVSGRGEEPERIDVAVPKSCQRARHGQFVPHRCGALESLRHPVRQPPQLRIAPAVLHSSAWAHSDKAAEWRLAAPVQRRLVRATDLRRSLDEMPRLRRHRLPLPDALQFRIRTTGLRYLDAWWERPRVVAEMDGAHHMEVGC